MIVAGDRRFRAAFLRCSTVAALPTTEKSVSWCEGLVDNSSGLLLVSTPGAVYFIPTGVLSTLTIMSD